jgi:hypothetical protein
MPVPNKPKGSKEKDAKPACRRSGGRLADRDLEWRHGASSNARWDPENLHPTESGEFVDIDPVYFGRPYYVYPDGLIAVEALRVIGAAMAQAGVVGSGASPSAGATGWSW